MPNRSGTLPVPDRRANARRRVIVLLAWLLTVPCLVPPGAVAAEPTPGSSALVGIHDPTATASSTPRSSATNVDHDHESADWLGRCKALVQAGQLVDAKTACERALAFDDRDWVARLNLGHSHLLAGDAASALQHYREALPRIETEQQLRNGPLADLDAFLRKGLQVTAAREASGWFQREWPRWQTVLELTREDIRLSQAGQLQEALRPSAEAARLCEEVLGPDHRETGTQLENLAQAHMALGDHARALPLLLRALSISERTRGPEHPATADVLNNLGSLYKLMGRNDQALPMLQRGLAIADKQAGILPADLGARVVNLAALLRNMGRNDEALPLYERALALAEQGKEPEGTVVIARLASLGALLHAMGRNQQALPLLERAQTLTERLRGPEHRETGIRLNNLAAVLRAMGQTDRALAVSRRAVSIMQARQGPNHRDTGASLGNLAGILESVGQFEEALATYQRALAIAEATDGPDSAEVGVRLNNLAGLLETMGDYDHALPLYERALAVVEKARGPEHAETGTSLNNLAALWYAMGQYDKALPLYQRALTIAEGALGPAHPTTGARLNNLAWLHIVMDQTGLALPLAERALAIAEQAQGPDHPATAIRLNNLAGLHEAIGQYTVAEPLYQRALVIALDAGQPELVWTVQGNLMGLYGGHPGQARALEQPDLAIWYGKQAINTLQSIRAGMAALDPGLQKSFVKKNESTYQTLANLLIDAGRIAEAEQVLAMLKQHELSQLLRSQERMRTQADYVGPEQRVVEAQRQLRNLNPGEAEELASLEARASSLSSAELLRQASLRQAAGQRRAAYHRFLTSLGGFFPRGVGSAAQADVGATATRMQDKVALDRTRAVGLHYVVADDRIGIIVATHGGSFGRFSAIPRSELNRQIAALRAAIVRRADPREPAQALWQALIAPVQADLQAAGAQTLVLSLTDTLRYLPFAALVGPSGRYLVEDYALNTWAAAVELTPDASQTLWRVSGLGLTRAKPGFAALPAVKSELQSIVRTPASPQGMLPGSIWLDEDFGRVQFEAALRGPNNVVHIASHFDFQPGDERRSVLLLGTATESLSLGQLATMDFSRVDLLTLSACETAVGGGRNERGAEVEGLAAVVLAAKGRSVLATLWKVSDDSTAHLMREFYAQRAGGQMISRAQALRQAQLAMLHGAHGEAATAVRGAAPVGPNGQPMPAERVDLARPWAHPYFWAPFVLSGNWL